MAQETKSKRAEELMKDPKKGLFKLALPMILMMLIQVMFNITDTYFVGGLGPEAIAALTLAFPIVFLMIAFASGIGTGVTSIISRYIGAHEKKKADNAAEHGIILSFLTAGVFTTLGFLFNDTLFSLFGLTGLTFEYGTAYMAIIFLGSIFMFFTFFASSILRGEGDVKTPTVMMTISIILNIILDPIFIYVFGFGVSGAAIATVISRIVSSLLFVYFLFVKKGSFVEFRMRSFKWNPDILKDILYVGIPTSFTQMSNAVSLMFVNMILATFGAAAVAAFGLYIRIESLVIMPIIGISMSLVTMVGMYMGAKNFKKLKEVVSYTNKINVLIMSTAAVLFYFTGYYLLSIFTTSEEVITIGMSAIQYLIFTLPFAAIGFSISSAFVGMGKGMYAFAINVFRTIILAVPLAYFFSIIMGYGYVGVWLGYVISSPINAVIAYTAFNFQKFEPTKAKSKSASQQQK